MSLGIDPLQRKLISRAALLAYGEIYEGDVFDKTLNSVDLL